MKHVPLKQNETHDTKCVIHVSRFTNGLFIHGVIPTKIYTVSLHHSPTTSTAF